MKTSFKTESDKMATTFEQPENDSNSCSQGSLNILDLVNRSTEYHSSEQTFSKSVQLEVNKIEHNGSSKSTTPEEDHEKDWSFKFVPDIYHSDKLSTFSCSDIKANRNNIKHNVNKKTVKKTISNSVNPVNMHMNYLNGDSNSPDLFMKKQNKEKSGESKAKKNSIKSREKINGVKKAYKLIAPYPDDRKCSVVSNSLQKLLTPQVNPILIVKIDDQGLNGDKQKLPDYLDSNKKKTEDSNHVLPFNYHNLFNDSETDLRSKKNFVTKTKCYKCCNCPFMTLNKDYLNYHLQKNEKYCANDEIFHCPGCKNIFYSLTPLRVHLVHDHKMLSKEVKELFQNIQEVRYSEEGEKSSCVFQSNDINGSIFHPDINHMDLSLTDVDNRGNINKNFEDRHIPESREPVESCSGGKRQTMLESYLDDINNKGDCNLPPTLSQNGSALLENTFNFTAPVNEQLPSIQPPPAHSASNSLMDQSHLMVEHQSHGYIGMANVFDAREENAYKASDPTPHYGEEANMMLSNENYLPAHIQDIPVINLDESNLGKSSPSVLSNDISIEDFSNYQENGSNAIGPGDNQCTVTLEGDDHEEKKKLKKLGVGFRCDINGCKVRLQSEKNIQYHRRCHEGTLYNCPECCKDCSTWISLSSHLWQAHKIDMELYKCDQCPYKTPSYSRLTNIHRGIHGKARPFLCDICGKGFKTVKQMRNHKNIHKAKMVRMSACHCEICGRTVADKRQLELHINNTHKKKKPFLCYMCGYASAVKHSLVVHMRRHTGEKPYACEKCEYKTADHNALRRHKMKHSGVRSYKCSHCTYTCIQASTYKVHIKTKHPGLEADVIFSCGQCNFQTLNRGSYLSHMSEHENFNGQVQQKPTRSTGSKQNVQSGSDYFGESNRIDLVGPIISDRVVETIVDLSGAHSLLEQEDYYNVERIAENIEDGHELKFKTSAVT